MFDKTLLVISLILAFIFWSGFLYFVFSGTAFRFFFERIIKIIFLIIWVEQLFISLPIKWLTGMLFEDGGGGFIPMSFNLLGTILTILINFALTSLFIYWILGNLVTQ